MKDNSKKILYHLTQLGYDSTLNDIASLVGVDESIISKELKKLDSRFRAKWYIEKNWYKLGLHSYLLIIRFDQSLKNRELPGPFMVLSGKSPLLIIFYLIFQILKSKVWKKAPLFYSELVFFFYIFQNLMLSMLL